MPICASRELRFISYFLLFQICGSTLHPLTDPRLHNSAPSFISLSYNQDTFANGSDTAAGTEVGRKQPSTQLNIIFYGSGQNPGPPEQKDDQSENRKARRGGSHLLMSPGLRGTRGEIPCQGPQSGQALARVEGRIDHTSLWAPQWQTGGR